MSYYDTQSYTVNTYNRESRLRAVAANAVREAVIAAGRIDQPYTDNDAAVQENIYNMLLQVRDMDRGERQNEHQALSITNTAPASTQAKIAAVLGEIDDQIRAEAEPLVKAKVPTAKA